MVVSPRGDTLINMESRVGIARCEINPKEKYYKPAGHGGAPRAHYEYIEEGRRPWLYRNGGASVVPFDSVMKYPRLCAHRGFNTVAPENTMPAFGAAVALGADEIEFDIWETKDGVLVSAHDETLERVSDGVGKIRDYTYEELLKLDFGAKGGEKFKGLKIPTFEEILKKFASRAVMNVHVKIWDAGAEDTKLSQILALVRKYDDTDHVYFMTRNDEAVRRIKSVAPDVKICLGWDKNPDPTAIVKRAISLGAYKVQFYNTEITREAVMLAHENGIRCNAYYADTADEARRLFDMGVDTVLTNDYLSMYNAVKDEYRGGGK
jgi:glycerophosphoryl diester phosphodiesterase